MPFVPPLPPWEGIEHMSPEHREKFLQEERERLERLSSEYGGMGCVAGALFAVVALGSVIALLFVL